MAEILSPHTCPQLDCLVQASLHASISAVATSGLSALSATTPATSQLTKPIQYRRNAMYGRPQATLLLCRCNEVAGAHRCPLCRLNKRCVTRHCSSKPPVCDAPLAVSCRSSVLMGCYRFCRVASPLRCLSLWGNISMTPWWSRYSLQLAGSE